MAPGVGFEPTTNALHLALSFLVRVDYIIIRFGGCGALSGRLLLGLTS